MAQHSFDKLEKGAVDCAGVTSQLCVWFLRLCLCVVVGMSMHVCVCVCVNSSHCRPCKEPLLEWAAPLST